VPRVRAPRFESAEATESARWSHSHDLLIWSFRLQPARTGRNSKCHLPQAYCTANTVGIIANRRPSPSTSKTHGGCRILDRHKLTNPGFSSKPLSSLEIGTQRNRWLRKTAQYSNINDSAARKRKCTSIATSDLAIFKVLVVEQTKVQPLIPNVGISLYLRRRAFSDSQGFLPSDTATKSHSNARGL
jgi:hypothetical protein